MNAPVPDSVAFALIRSDHREIRECFAALLAAHDIARRPDQRDALCAAIDAPMFGMSVNVRTAVALVALVERFAGMGSPCWFYTNWRGDLAKETVCPQPPKCHRAAAMCATALRTASPVTDRPGRRETKPEPEPELPGVDQEIVCPGRAGIGTGIEQLITS